jgi:hypothetical protein
MMLKKHMYKRSYNSDGKKANVKYDKKESMKVYTVERRHEEVNVLGY